MDRQALQLLLRSGRVLCFDIARLSAQIRATADPGRYTPMLFDEPVLNDTILFKEITQDQVAENPPEITTRLYFPYISDDADQGGESILADPDQIMRAVEKSQKRKPDRRLNPHDQRIIQLLTELPSFDPFLLLSRRPLLESERAIHPAYFDIDEREWQDIRRPVMEKIARLVGRAMAEVEDPEASANAHKNANAVLDAVWKGTASKGARDLMASFRLRKDRTPELLFAWKGINYYEFQYQASETKFTQLVAWLNDPDQCLPRNAAVMPMEALNRLKRLRDQAHRVSARNLSSVRLILKQYNTAFDALIGHDEPRHFQRFLDKAPVAFVDLGMALGLMTHCANAWADRTKGGQWRLGAQELEPLLEFMVNLNGGAVPSLMPALRV